jgi:hypothetical protein
MTYAYNTLLAEAVNQPGKMLEAYRAFHTYSISNQILAMLQGCCEPINTYKGWQALGRQVKKGAKAIELCMPVTCKREDAETGEEVGFTRFIFRRNWFGLSMTEGTEYTYNVPVEGWNKAKALAGLGIEQVEFRHINGNCMGYAKEKQIAVSALAPYPHKTTFHELAHVVLCHTTEGEMTDDETLTRSIKEVEAESVAYILLNILGLQGLEYSRGYIQSWLAGGEVPEKSAQRIFAAANKILKAGRE